jgi:antitoxin component YwqK of YwqJK toxin-antitoxin module
MMQENYEILGEEFEIIDEELGLKIRSKLEFLDKDYFPDGNLRYETFRKGEKLHGPSTYYGNGGEILSQAWYFEGVKFGKAWRYYPNGQLYSLERFIDGKPHLKQEYYYIDGACKTIIHFDHGIYDGETKLFWPDGTLKRECLFHQGKKENDKFYDENGNLATALS